MSDGSHLKHLGAILWNFAVIRECLEMLRVVGHLPWLLACCELGWAGVGQASGEETAGGLRSVFLQMWSMEI